MNVLLKLSPYLVEKIEAFLEIDPEVEASSRLAQSTTNRLQSAVKSFRATGTPKDELTEPDGDADDVGRAHSSEDDAIVDLEDTTPPTIDEEALVELSRWATSDVGMVSLKRKEIDPHAYSLISLLAGTEVYLPPAQIQRLKAAENPDNPNPYLPSYLSPRPPSLGSEYRQLTRNLTTVLNILFSIFGSAFAVYAAGVGGAGYSRETATLLAILAGGVVGVADGVLVWIFSDRVKKGRAESEKLARQSAQGPAPTLIQEQVKSEAREQGLDAEAVGDGKPDTELGIEPGTSALPVPPKREIRLRRRGLHNDAAS